MGAGRGDIIIAVHHCDPTTLALDVKNIIEKGYKWESVTPFDLFPQTGHVESVVLMSRVHVEATE